MQSSQQLNFASHTHDLDLDIIKETLGASHVCLHTRRHGGNSAVYQVEADGQYYALKSYPPYAPDQRDRLAAEVGVYQFLIANGIHCIPKLKAWSNEERWLAIEWINGVMPDNYSSQDIDAAVEFLKSVAELNQLPSAQQLLFAAEPCLSLKELSKQIQLRMQRLNCLPSEPALSSFINNDFMPVFLAYQEKAFQAYYVHNIDPLMDLKQNSLSLIPADFGFHNSLKSMNKLYFFDFDYFGWDDPVKLLADILWHPKMMLADWQRDELIQKISSIYSADNLFMTRFTATYPLFGLRWVLILLNEFLPAFWQNRQHATLVEDQIEAKQRQLNRAKEYLHRISL